MALDVTTRTGQKGPVRTKFSDPAPPEIPDDVFDRQRVILDFDQPVVEEQVAFVLGTGGLGQAVAVGLCRLGVKKVYLLDCKAYGASNLTRQILGGLKDVGKRKVDVAADNIAVHNLRSEIVPLHWDAVQEWRAVVDVARQCNVLFNCIDFGSMFDYAVNALSKELQIPYVAGSSYGYSLQVEFFSGKSALKCWSCTTPVSSAFKATTGAAGKQRVVDEAKEWLAAKGQDSGSLSKSQALEYVQEQLRMKGGEAYLDTAWDAVRDQMSADGVLPVDALPSLNVALKDTVLNAMSPGRISTLDSIAFVPREKSPPTRSVGSWVGVCVAAGMLMVNAWVQCLTGELRDDFPNSSELTLLDFSAMTDRTYGGVGSSDADCEVCKAAVELYGPIPPPPPPQPPATPDDEPAAPTLTPTQVVSTRVLAGIATAAAVFMLVVRR